jgi:hypothetical protein
VTRSLFRRNAAGPGELAWSAAHLVCLLLALSALACDPQQLAQRSGAKQRLSIAASPR